ERWREPIRRAGKSRTDLGAFRRRPGAVFINAWSALFVDAFGPIQLLRKLRGRKEFAGHAIQYIDESVAVGFDKELARFPFKLSVDQNRGFGGVVIVEIVRGELEIPF